MAIQYRKSRFQDQNSMCPYIYIYDTEDIQDIKDKLIDTEELAATIGDFEYLPVFSKLRKLLVLCGEFSQLGLINLYNHKDLEALCFDLNYINSKDEKDEAIDLREFPNLQALYTWEYNVKYLPSAISLKTLGICSDMKNLQYISELKNIDSLAISGNKIQSLHGIENMKLQCFSISSSRKLTDISSLEYSYDTLQFLRIDHCPNISDLSILGTLHNLKSLVISGYKGQLDSLSFLDELSNLNYFVTDYNVIDGNLSKLKRISYASIINNRKHYNLKDEDLCRKSSVVLGNESIPLWRRIAK